MSCMKPLTFSAALVAVFGTGAVQAQNFSSAGQDWSTGWGFSSASDRSIALQSAQAIRNAQQAAGPSTVINNYTNNTNSYDNRSSYQEIIGDGLTLDTIDFQLNGDRIGQNTNSVGSMNTGTTNIDITGDANSIVATNSSDSDGCVDASIQEDSNLFETMASPSGIDISVNAAARSMACQ